MAMCRLCFLLLLQSASMQMTVDSEESESSSAISKTIKSKPDLTPICTNGTENIITLIVCKIRTERSREECRLLYQHGQDFVHECDSRFTLRAQNQTVFLHLTSLTPEDSGNYTCQCSFHGGTDTLHLNVTVEEDEDVISSTQSALIGPLIVSIMTGVIFGLIHRKRRRPESPAGHTNMEPPDIEPYSTFIQTESGLYSTARVHVCPSDTPSDMFTTEDSH